MSYPDYNQPEYGHQSSSMAVISLIAGIASFFIVPLLGAIAAIITGGMAKKEIRQSGGRISGLGMANWGVCTGLDQYCVQPDWAVHRCSGINRCDWYSCLPDALCKFI